MALYTKYRPKTFFDLVGQDTIRRTLQSAVVNKMISHAYLFSGSRGTGKTSTARILAKAINCKDIQKNGDPCGICELCTAADAGRMTDLIEIDAASERKIEDVRDLIEKIAYAPNFGRAKVYIIDEVHMLTKEAFNALLKTLEEPPSHAFFILATTEFHKVPETIRSRCQTFSFKKITDLNIVERLRYIAETEGFAHDESGLFIIAQRAEGGMRDAISLLERCASWGSLTKKELVESLGILSSDIFHNFYEALAKKDGKSALGIIDALLEEGRDLEEFSKGFLSFLRERFFEQVLSKGMQDLPWVLEVVDIFEKANWGLKNAEIPPLPLEIAIGKTLLLGGQFSIATQMPSVQKKEQEEVKIKEEIIVEVASPEVPKKSPQKADSLSLPTLQSDWHEKVVKKISGPLRIIVASSFLENLEGQTLHISFSTTSGKEKAQDIENKQKLEKAISDILEQDIAIEIVEPSTDIIKSPEEMISMLDE
jgi:DNA polymerase III subunit gamma/tau